MTYPMTQYEYCRSEIERLCQCRYWTWRRVWDEEFAPLLVKDIHGNIQWPQDDETIQADRLRYETRANEVFDASDEGKHLANIKALKRSIEESRFE